MTNATKDPVCGKEVDPLRARAVGIFGGVTYYFCSAECKGRFVDPRKTPREPTRPEAKPAVLARPALKVEKPEAKPAKADAAEAVARAAEREPEAAPVPTRPPRAAEPSASVEIKVDPTPSVQMELAAARGGGTLRSWLVVFFLFAAAGVVLYFAFRK